MKARKVILNSLLFLLISIKLFSQTLPINVSIEPLDIVGLGGIQSFAFGQADGKWLIIGGRLDGLHQRQPFATFDIAGHNTQLIVVDPVLKQKWSAPLTSLSVPLQEQLKSTNMEFYQLGKYLYLFGGYGYSATIGDHTTFNKLTAIDVPSTINAIINNKSFVNHFRQITDNQFQVTGGRLEKINNTFYLVGGQKFIGRYNPMGPNHGPGFIQEYTDQIRKFKLSDDGTNLVINHLPSLTDAVNLHRRDYNVAPQILPNGNEGITAFSGVFQPTVNLPFLNCVNIDSTNYQVNNNFSQYYNHYHCANFSIYSEKNNLMNTVFFGGIAQYFDVNGVLTQNNDVPFVKTIARVERDKIGKMAEYKFPNEMPTYLGAGSEFIPVESISKYENGVFKYDDINGDSILIGYIYGGIKSSDLNIFFINDGTQSSANSQIFKVYFKKTKSTDIHELNPQSTGTLKINVFPNPGEEDFNIKFNLIKETDVKLTIKTVLGEKIEEVIYKNLQVGENVISKRIEKLIGLNAFFITIDTKYESATQQILINP